MLDWVCLPKLHDAVLSVQRTVNVWVQMWLPHVRYLVVLQVSLHSLQELYSDRFPVLVLVVETILVLHLTVVPSVISRQIIQ